MSHRPGELQTIGARVGRFVVETYYSIRPPVPLNTVEARELFDKQLAKLKNNLADNS